MDKHTCKLCFRRFSNGRALGGHMRSHIITTSSTAPKSRLPAGNSPASSASTEAPPAVETALAEEEDEVTNEKGLEAVSYRLRENPRKSFRLVDPEFSSFFVAIEAACSVVVQDRESESESLGPSRRRSKRVRRVPFATVAPLPLPSPPDQLEPEPTSSVSDTTPEEDVALCLMMLSRDYWTAKAEAEEYDEVEQDSKSNDDRPIAVRSRPAEFQGRDGPYKCGTCKKVFRSFQALGGHRASNKKSRGGCVPVAKCAIYGSGGDDAKANAGAEESKIHQCPFCFRVFSSGQALGGHKRSHLIASTTTIAINSTLPVPLPPQSSPPASTTADVATKYSNKNLGLIDLNLPAPMDNEDVELSAVSDAEFV